MQFPSNEVLQDALLWEEGVCLECGEVSEPLEELDRVQVCECCGARTQWPAVLLAQVKACVDDAALPF